MLMVRRYSSKAYEIIKEKLSGTNACLTSFIFHHGANFYVFSYEKAGVTSYTFVDTGDWRYRNQVLSILKENNIDLSNIERIIITHRHPDHCGLADILAAGPRAKILVHSNFRSFVEGEISQEERRWLGGVYQSRLKGCDIVYLPQLQGGKSINISGVDFPSLMESIEIGDSGKLEILACPESVPTHSPDQIIVLYTPGSNPYTHNEKQSGFMPTDEILFPGDLWLMIGPLFGRDFRSISWRLRFGVRRLRSLISGKDGFRRDPREQDTQAKEALKRGFCLIRVKPGHNEEFIGSRIIPKSLLADRDLLIELGYSNNVDKSILSSSHLLPKIADIKEKAYSYFVGELRLWIELGYTINDVSELLVRIYKEQSGGSRLVRRDRKERRARLKETLYRLEDDKVGSDQLCKLAETTLSKLEAIQ